jgi:hypothetical protein
MTQVGPSLSFGDGLFFDPAESFENSGNSEIRRALAAVAQFVCECEIVFLVLSPSRYRNDVVNFDLVSMELQVDGVFANEANAALSGVQSLD